MARDFDLPEEQIESLKRDAKSTAIEKYEEHNDEKKLRLAVNYLELDPEDVKESLGEWGPRNIGVDPDSEYGKAFIYYLDQAMRAKGKHVIEEELERMEDEE